MLLDPLQSSKTSRHSKLEPVKFISVPSTNTPGDFLVPGPAVYGYSEEHFTTVYPKPQHDSGYFFSFFSLMALKHLLFLST